MNATDAIALHGEAAVSQAARHALWRAGDLSWLLHEGAEPNHNGQVQARERVMDAQMRRVLYFVLEIGRRWGKSFFCCWWVLELLLRIELAGRTGRAPYACGTITSLREFIVPIMTAIAATAPPELRPEIVGFEVRMAGGSRIPMQGCEDRLKADRLRGAAANGAVVDEAGFIAVLRYVIESVLQYQLAHSGGLLLIASSPSDSPSHPFTSYADAALARNAYSHATIHDSPLIAPEEISRLCDAQGGPLTNAWRREALAERVVDEHRAIIPEFGPAESEIVKAVEQPLHFDPCVIGDLGFVDFAALLYGYWHFALAVIIIEDELFTRHARSDEITALSTKIEGERWGARLVRQRRLDGTARERADMRKLMQPSEEAGSQPRWDGVNNQERDAAVNALRLDVQRGKILIHPRCVQLRAHLRGGLWNERRTDFERTDELGHCDGVSALMYFARHVDRNRNPNPDPVFSHQTHFVPTGANKPKSGWASLGQGPRRQ